MVRLHLGKGGPFRLLLERKAACGFRERQAPAKVDSHGHSITDERVGMHDKLETPNKK